MATLFCETCRKLNWMTFIKPRVESMTPVSKRGKQESFLRGLILPCMKSLRLQQDRVSRQLLDCALVQDGHTWSSSKSSCAQLIPVPFEGSHPSSPAG